MTVKFRKHLEHWLMEEAIYDKPIALKTYDKIESYFPRSHIMTFITNKLNARGYNFRIRFFTDEEEAYFIFLAGSGVFDI